MMNHKDEHVIYIKDLLFAAAYSWRLILVGALALALLLGCYRGLSLKGSAGTAVSQEALEDYQQQKDVLSLEIESLEERVDAFSTYITNSPFMALNPHSVYVTEVFIYLEPSGDAAATTADTDPADTLLDAYRRLLLSDETQKAVAAALDMDGANMEHILCASYDELSNLLTVAIRQADQEKTDAATVALAAAITVAQEKVTQAMGEHKLSMLGSSTTLRNDIDLAAAQDLTHEALAELKEDLKTTAQEQNALVAPAAVPLSGKQILVSAVKYAVLGGLLGCFAVAGMVMLLHLARIRVYSRRTLEDQTGLHILGCIPAGKKRCPIDTLLRKLEGRCVENADDQGALIATHIRNLCGSESTIVLSGGASADDRLPLVKALEAAGCKVVANGDLLRDRNTASAMATCTGIVLMEQCGKSLYASVNEAADQAEALGKPVLGCVLIDG